MALNVAKVRRDKGEVSIAGSAIGMLDPFEGEVSIITQWDKIEIRPVETGVLERILHAGIDVRMRIVAGEKNAATIAAAFNDYASAETFTVDDASYVPGQDISGVAVSFAGRIFTFTASNCVVTISDDAHNIGVPQRPQPIVLDVRVMKHSTGDLIAMTAT